MKSGDRGWGVGLLSFHPVNFQSSHPRPSNALSFPPGYQKLRASGSLQPPPRAPELGVEGAWPALTSGAGSGWGGTWAGLL